MVQYKTSMLFLNVVNDKNVDRNVAETNDNGNLQPETWRDHEAPFPFWKDDGNVTHTHRNETVLFPQGGSVTEISTFKLS